MQINLTIKAEEVTRIVRQHLEKTYFTTGKIIRPVSITPNTTPHPDVNVPNLDLIVTVDVTEA